MPNYIDPRTGRENPAITDRAIIVAFTYAGDDEYDSEMRPELFEALRDIAEVRGLNLTVLTSDDVDKTIAGAVAALEETLPCV